MSGRVPISAASAPPPVGGFSHAVRAGDLLFLSGQGPFDAEGSRVGESIADQVRQTLANLATVASAAGASFYTDAVRVGIYLSDMRHFAEMDITYRELFPEPRPARTTIASNLVGFDVEIDAVVWMGGGDR
ncbi:MAG: 2-iminobutanoate/2-iminopropanoate deaminase [Thermoleophilaceae bacterium]|jgi:reactive intermediate/imine deaminase|nr:2-iminobutanoate/2-iminopropanoate deaminase [Thermoleophilaceae bacterium]